MKKITVALFLILILVSNGSPAVFSQGIVQDQSANAVAVVKSDDESIILRMTTREFQIHEEELEGHVYSMVKVEGYSSNTDWGHPQVPARQVLLGIPLGAEVQVRILDSTPRLLAGSYELAPVPRPMIDRVAALTGSPDALVPNSSAAIGRASRPVLVYSKDQGAYAQDSFRPGKIAEVVDEGFLRNQRFVRLALYPFQYNPVSKELRQSEELTVELSFSYPSGRVEADRVFTQPQPAFDPVLESAILNYDSARAWRARQVVQGRQPPLLPSAEPFVKIMVDEDGMYKVTRSELEALTIPVATIDPSTFKLYHQGAEVRIRVFESLGVLDYLVFYGQKVNTKYTDTNVYWLTYGGAAGLRMTSRSAPPSGLPVRGDHAATVHLEENAWYYTYIPWAEGDHWWWTYTYNSDLDASVTLDHAVNSGYNATLRASMHGFLGGAHCIQLLVNNNFVNQWNWSDETALDISEPFSATFLQDGANEITARGCSPGDFVFHNWFEVDYRDYFVAENNEHTFTIEDTGYQYEVSGFTLDSIEVYDITDHDSLGYLTGFVKDPPGGPTYTAKFDDPLGGVGTQYWLVADSALKSPAGLLVDTASDLVNTEADYIIIAPAEFLVDLDPERDLYDLLAHRAGEGLTAIAVDVQDVYDEFSGGVFTPQGIRDYLDYAFHNWANPPSYVVLVGDGHRDYKDYLGTGTPNRIPPQISFADVYQGEVAIDNWYVAVSGSDILPDIHIGRLPAGTMADVTAMVTKIVDYEQNPPAGTWKAYSLFTTDKIDAGAGNFPAESRDLVANNYPASYTYHEAYIAEPELLGGCPDGNPASVCRQEVIGFFNAGGVFAHYIGHAGPKNWTNKQLFDTSAVAGLSLNDKLPVTFSAACLIGDFVDPNVSESALGESLVRADGKGSVADFSMTGQGLSVAEHYLSKGFMDAIFMGMTGTRELGPATLLAKTRVAASGLDPHLVDTYTLFGDPALDVVDDQPTAVELSSFSVTFQNGAIQLQWETASELDNLGFNLYRAESPDGARIKLNVDLIPSQNPGSPVGARYEFVDESVAAGAANGGTYFYWLEAVDVHGATQLHGPVSASLDPLRRLLPARPRLVPHAPIQIRP